MFKHIIGCIFRILISITVLQADHDGGLAMMSMMGSTMTGEIMAIDSGNDDIKNDREKDTYPER